MILEIGVLIIALSVAVLVVVLVQTLRKAQASLEAAGAAIREVQGAVQEWKGDVDDLVVSVKDLTNQVNHQIDAVDPLMASIREVGETVHQVAAAARDFSSGWTTKLRRKAKAAAQEADTLPENVVGTAAYAGTSVPIEPKSRTGIADAGIDTPAPASKPGWSEWIDLGIHAVRLIRQRQRS